MDVSLIIPVYNEEKNIRLLHGKVCAVMESLKRDFEIIYINDGSVDGSLMVLEDIRREDPKVKLINFDVNYGQTSALDAGFRYAQGKHILTMDADMQSDANDLVKIYAELQTHDVVIGNRINRLECDGLVKFLSSRIANGVRNLVLRENFKDVGCFLRGYKRECIEGLVLYRGLQVFILSLLNMKGYKIKELDVTMSPRKFGKSNYGLNNRLLKELIALFFVRWCKDNALHYCIKYIRTRNE
jgi:glycosyltransferase involved in cell wall biosynthesis